MSMVLVNNPGSQIQTYRWLVHARWMGWTFADTVFPAFLWIVGVAITLSTAYQTGRGDSRSQQFKRGLRRSAMLLACGLLLEGFPHFVLEAWQFTGVLQKISLAYLFALTIFLWTTWRGQVLALLGVSVAYWVLMVVVPVPNCIAEPWSAECNTARYIDTMILHGHTSATPTNNDPDGILSVLSSTSTVLLGVLAGQMMRANWAHAHLPRALLMTGSILVAGGVGMSRWIPVSKVLWTPSFVVLMAGLSSIAFAICHWAVVDRKLASFTKPLEIFGLNAIAAYVASRLIPWPLKVHIMGRSIYTDLLLPIASPINASLLFALLNVLVVYALVWWMYARKIFVTF